MTPEQYNRSILLCKDIKLLQGPSGLSATLRRHKSFAQKLLEYQVEDLKSLEIDLDIQDF